MPHPIEPSTLRILNAKGQTIGTGFLVSKTLAVTCVHVALSASMDGENRIRVKFRDEKRPVFAKVLDEFFDIDRDVAILQVDEVPAGISPLRLGHASESKLKNDLYTFGYAIAAGEQGIGGLGTFIRQDGNFVQFRMHEADHGHSGAPLYDDKRGVVVGMVKEGKDETGRNDETTFAIPSETIWQVCPQLKPTTPVLPRRNPIVEGINLLPYDYDQRIQNFLGEYLGNEAHPVPFGGRDDAMKMLNDWRSASTPYLLLAAPAGRGKSALLVRWLDSLSSREDLALVFIPVSIRFGTSMERVFYAALAARLAFLQGDDVPASPETSTAVYRGLVSDYLSKPLANGRTLLVVLDGLDEAADWQAGADFMPSELPTGVRVVVSARFLAGDADHTAWLRRLNWERNGLASRAALAPLDQGGVADVLLKMSVPLEELSRNVNIVAELHRLSAGDPLLISLYVSDLWAKGAEVTRLKPDDLSGIQPGYKGYFDRWWNEQETMWREQTATEIEQKKDEYVSEKIQEVQDILNLLSGAFGPLTMNDLLELAQDISSIKLKNILKPIQRFVIGNGYEQGYTFSHPKLGQYFWERLAKREKRDLEERFVTWGEQTLQEFIVGKRNPKKKDEAFTYVVRNYSAHLTRAKQPIDKWLPLIHHQQWAQAWFTVEGAYGGYLQDVQRVWDIYKIFDRQIVDTTGKARSLGKQIRCALIEASLHSLAGSLPPELVAPLVRDGIWTMQQTWVFICQMPDSEQKSDAISALIPTLDDKQLPEALKAAQMIKDEFDCVRLLHALTQRLPEGLLVQVLEAAQIILKKHEGLLAYILSELAKRLPEVYLGQVLELAWAMKGDWECARVLSTLAQRLPNVRGEALKAARAFHDEGKRARLLVALAQCLPEVMSDALETVRAIKDHSERAHVMCTLSELMPDVGADAIVAAQAIENNLQRNFTLTKLAQHLPEEQLIWILEAPNPRGHTRTINVLIAIAQRLPEEYLEQLLEQVRTSFLWEYERACVFSALAQRLPEVSDEALEAARLAKNDEKKQVKALSELAQRLPEEYLNQVLEMARAIRSDSDRTQVLSALAQRRPGVTEEALLTSRVISDEKALITVLSALIQYLSKEYLEQMLMIARKIKDDDDRARMLSRLVHHLPAVTSEALDAAQEIKDERTYVDVLSVLAQQLPERYLKYVLKVARAIRNAIDRANVLSALAQRFPELTGEVLETVGAMVTDNDGYRSHVLDSLTEYLQKRDLGQVLEVTRALNSGDARANVLVKLAQRFPEITHEALEAARAINSELTRVKLLSVLAQRIPEISIEVIETARAVRDDEWERASALSELAKHLPEEYLGQVLGLARMIKGEWECAYALSALAERLPEEYLGQVLDLGRAMEYEKNRALVLSTLAQRLPELTGEALEATWVIDNTVSDERTEILSTLVKPMIVIPLEKCYLQIETSLPELSKRKRSELFSDIAALMPVIIHLGTDDTPREIYEAVRDVTTWWP